MSTEKTDAPLHALPWLQIAEAYERMGILEVSGPKAHPMIVAFHKHTTLQATSDEIPWCSSFACACMEQAGLRSTRSAAARSWLKWGSALEGPSFGCIVVLDRSDHTNKNAAHVGFIVHTRVDDNIGVLGGNQRNSVCIAPYNTARVLGYRWPLGWPS